MKKVKLKPLSSAIVSILTFLILYWFAYIFLGVYTGECGSTTRRWVGNFETVIIAVFSILIGNLSATLQCGLSRRKSTESIEGNHTK